MKKLLSLLLSLVFVLVMFAGCGKKTETPAPQPTEQPAQQTEQKKPAEVAVIIKATDSDFWQSVLIGAENYAKENPDKVHVTTYGPASEADIDKQVAILEDVISSKPDAIVIASTSSDATVPALEKAAEQGIKVITIDNKVNTETILSHLATDNVVGGALCADMLVEGLKAKNIPLKGKVGMVSAMAGVQVLDSRDQGFLDRLKEIAPDLKPLPIRYIDNDILKGLSAAEDLLTANKDIVAFFGNNNHSGDGVARALKERNLKDKVVAVAYDSDPEEVQALRDGFLYALIVQDPYGMGYKGVDGALKALAGETLEKFVNTGANAVTAANMDDPKMKGLLDPTTLKK
jgi:ribose transport system substrate-binding protein